MDKYEIEKVKVYRMNDYSWFASKWDKEKTNQFYCEEYGDNDIENVEECDIDKEGVWIETEDEKDIEELGDGDKLEASTEKRTIGDLMRRGFGVYKFTSFRGVLEGTRDFTEPYEIGTTEW